MIREEQLLFCKKCQNRKMNVEQGLLCGLTNEKAAFENTCPDFKDDPSVANTPSDESIGYNTEELENELTFEMLEQLKMEQQLIPAIVTGCIAGLLGAVVWGVISVVTGYQIGYLALAIGAGVGFTIRKFGKGIEKIFGIFGAAIALLSVVFGNFLSIVGQVANYEGLGYLETILMIDYSLLPDIMMETFSVIDILFYGLAIVEGYKFSFRQITQEELIELKKQSA
ncbi:hypothetical protein HNQ88_004225 [Aureibacter tunicatorum]|uniref:Uncharacterized protein n=2 Tax=Aureibacter tunicatorum TaxID=866807 RepID=A0AAE4BSE3_9BACT|nr:hypothetical protein [Aureibacter tunicatorum]BDD03926.1 hypothetical protein AUTU_14090 [Aureibacter tunicatorum]